MTYQHKYFIVNGTVQSCFDIQSLSPTVIYEVIRVQNGIPLFLEKHINRLQSSADMLNKKIPYSFIQFSNFLQELISENQIPTGNMKITLEYDDNAVIKQSVMGFIPHSYPSEEEYSQGVKVVSSIDYRKNPNAKVQNDDQRTKFNELMKKENAYEVLLVHPDGYVTEGSRSNIFFIHQNSIITAPDKDILAGITRDLVIQIINQTNYSLRLETLKFSEIVKMDAAFITGTSPKVLPIKSIDSITLNLPNNIINSISEQYEHLINSYVTAHNNSFKPNNK